MSEYRGLRRRRAGPALISASSSPGWPDIVGRLEAIPTAADPVIDALRSRSCSKPIDRALSGRPPASRHSSATASPWPRSSTGAEISRARWRGSTRRSKPCSRPAWSKTSSRLNAAFVRSKERALGDPARPPPFGACRRRPVGRDNSLSADRDVRVDPDRTQRADRGFGGSGPRLGGLSVLVEGHDLDLDDPTVARILGERGDPLSPMRGAGVARSSGKHRAACVRYKSAAEIASWGQHPALRGPVRADELLRLFCVPPMPAPRCSVIRVGDVGIISEPNAHPLDNGRRSADSSDGEQPRAGTVRRRRAPRDMTTTPTWRALASLHVRPRSPPTPGLIPALVSRRIAAGTPTPWRRSERRSLRSRDRSRSRPRSRRHRDRCSLPCAGAAGALRRMPDDVYVVASEPLRAVEVAPTYLRLDGETMPKPANPASQGRPSCSTRGSAGDPTAITRCATTHAAAHRPQRWGRRDHDARRRPRRCPALPPQGDHERRVVPQDTAGQAGRDG